MTLTTGGNVGIGTTTPSFISGYGGVQINGGGNGSVLHLTNGFTGTTSTDGFDLILVQGSADAYVWQRESAPLIFGTSSTERMRITSAGNVSIGTTGGSYKLNVTSSSIALQLTTSTSTKSSPAFNSLDGAVDLCVTAAGGDGFSYIGNFSNHPLTFGTNNTERMRITSAGDVGIGTSSPSGKLHVLGSGGTRTITADTTGYAASLSRSTGGDFYVGINDSAGTAFGSTAYSRALWADGAYPMVFATNSTERMRITSSGNLLVGTTSFVYTAAGTNISGGQINIGSAGTGGATLMNFGNGNGAVGSITVSGTTTSYNINSDYRLKDITGRLTGYKERIMALQPKQGSWKVDGSEFKGFVAHEFAEQYPTAVSGKKDAVDAEGKPQYQGMQAGGSETIADLVALVQELSATVDAQAARIATLESN
jgi:uncharacterized protein YaiE (UPF0345 family)